MAYLLKMIARGNRNDFLISKMFTIARSGPNFLKGLVAVTEKATMPSLPKMITPQQPQLMTVLCWNESRSVLLDHYGRKVAHRIVKNTLKF